MSRSCNIRVIRNCLATMVAVAVFTVAASPASAATYSWLAKSGTGDWTTASNWSLNSSYPGADAANLDVAQFNGDLTGPLGANLDTSVSIASLFLGDAVQTGVSWFPTTVSTTNASTLRFVTTGTAIISLVGANSAGTENLIAPDIFINAPTLEFRNNLTSGGGANGRGNLALTGNITSGTTGNHIIRVTPAGNTTNTCYWDFRGNITDGPGVVSFFFRKDGTTGSSATRTIKLSGTGNTFSGGINFTSGSGAIIESSPASGTTGALGTGLITMTTSANATLNLGGSLSTVTEVAGINIGAGTKRIANIGAGHRILSGTVNQASGQPLTLACSNAGNLTFSNAFHGTGPVTISSTGSGKVIFSGTGSTHSGTVTIQSRGLQLAGGSALAASKIVPLAGGTMTLTPALQAVVGGLSPNAGGLTDVGSGHVTVAAGLPVADLLVALNAGRGDGSWSGTSGITSSTATANVAATIPRTVGWLDNGDGSMTFAYAAPGDTNLDWQIDVLDAGNFLSFGKFDTGLPATWLEGDFNYDGVVDVLDAADFFGTGLYDAGVYNPPAGAAGALAAVPEPSGLGAVALVAVAWLVHRRTRRRWFQAVTR